MVDSREHNAPYMVKRFGNAGIDAEITCLPTETGSDFVISNLKGSCAVQRKIVVPEMISELDEILYEILPRLKNYNPNPCILLEENYLITKDGYLANRNDHRETQMLATSYFGYLETIKKMGIDVVTTRDINQSIWWMIAMHGYLAKEHYPKHRKYFTVPEQAVGMLCTVPTIGEVRAGKALKLSSIRGMCGMKVVEGLTMKQSEKLQNVLRYRG